MPRTALICNFLLGFALFATATVWAADRALVVGIDNYAHVQPLRGPRNDADNMKHFLITHLNYDPAQIRMLLDGEATRAGILHHLESWLQQDTRPGDRVFFYFSGHGFQIADDNGDEQDGLDETLVVFDSHYDGVQKQYRNMIRDDELNALFARLDDRAVTIVIDSCHSGTMTRTYLEAGNPYQKTPVFNESPPVAKRSRAYEEHRQEESLLPATDRRVVWSAVSPVQIALVDREAPTPGSVFTRRFLAGVEQDKADRNGNGIVSNAELLDYVQQQSADYCARNPRDCRLGLTPVLEIQADKLGEAVSRRDKIVPSMPELAADLLGHDNPMQVRVELLGAMPFRLGGTIQLRVLSPRSGYLIVLDINARGEVMQLFPNQYSDKAGKGNRIQANRVIVIPDAYYGFEFKAREPAGRGRLLAIVTEDAAPLDQLLADRMNLQVIPRPADYLTALAGKLREVWTQDEKFNRALKWSLMEVEYEIVP